MKIKKALKAQGGFTLIEMLIVVAIIAILVAVSIPMVNSNLEKARKAADDANERAAKTAALMEYTNNNDTTKFKKTAPTEAAPNTTLEGYYDAANGTIVPTSASKPTAYAKQTDDAHKNKVVKVTLTITPSGDVTCTTEWA